MPSHVLRRLRHALLVLPVLVMAAPLLTVTPAQASVVNGVTLNRYETALVSGINAQRSAHGLPALAVASGTTDVARRWAQRMAGVAAISHNPALASSLSAAGSASWHFLAENVGYATADDARVMVTAYMNSAPHRANILDPRARYVGVGAVDALVSGFRMAFNTLDFVDSYSSSYGHTREPADAMPIDGGVVTSTRTLGAFEGAWDPRLRTAVYGTGVAASGALFTGPTTADDAARFSVRATTATATGGVDLLLRLPLDLRQAHELRLTLGASTASGEALPLTVMVGDAKSLVTVGTVLASGARAVSLTLPTAARRFNDQIRLRVSAGALDRLGAAVADQSANVKLYQVDAVV